MTTNDDIFSNVDRDYPDYLRDESRLTGTAQSISFPRTEEELKNRLAEACREKTAVTLQGARTGITGGAVPNGGHILNLGRMNRISGLRKDPASNAFLLSVQPGVLLSEIRQAITEADGDYFFPPDPTEDSASIGGMAACNASGARSFFYGSTRRYVERIRVVLSDGSVLNLRRGGHRTHSRSFSVKTDTGREIKGSLPSYKMPRAKSAAGYFVSDDMDLVDLFIGSEGTLGIFSEIEIRLIPAPSIVWGVMISFPCEKAAIGFVEEIRETGRKENTSGGMGPVAIEFFDCKSLDLLRRQKETNPAFKEIANIPPEWHTAIYTEYHGDDEETVESAVMNMSEMMITHGGSEDTTWLASDAREMKRLKDFRHAVPEAVNLLIDERRKMAPALTKLGTDLAVPDAMLNETFALYHEGLDRARLEYVIFGHIGDNHVHVNIIPNDMEEYERGSELCLAWARAVVGMGGTVSGEHGIGKLKTALLKEMLGEEGIGQMRDLHNLFDPHSILNPGNLFTSS